MILRVCSQQALASVSALQSSRIYFKTNLTKSCFNCKKIDEKKACEQVDFKQFDKKKKKKKKKQVRDVCHVWMVESRSEVFKVGDGLQIISGEDREWTEITQKSLNVCDLVKRQFRVIVVLRTDLFNLLTEVKHRYQAIVAPLLSA